jgi:uncharacterized protein (DUF433 family)
MERPVISRDPDVMGGTPVFAGTRVPVQTLLDYLEAGDSIDDFLKGFPSVHREQVIAFLEQAMDRLVPGADEETTKRLPIEVGARGSEKDDGFWGFITHHPFGETDQ